MELVFRGRPMTVSRMVSGISFRVKEFVFPTPLRPVPWLTDGSIDAIEQFIDDRRRAGRPLNALEFGAGASTVWLASRVDSIISFEHHKPWHRKVLRQLRKQGQTNVDARLYSLPYYQHIDALPDAAFDIILVDGKDRVECVKRAISKLASEGLFIFDNTELVGTPDAPERWFDALEYLAGMEREDFEQVGPDRTGFLSATRQVTTLWRRSHQPD